MRPPGADTDTDTDTDPGAHRRVCLGLNGHSRVVYAVYALNSLDTEDPVYAVYAMSLPDLTGPIDMLWRSPFLVKKWAEPFGQRVRTYVTHPEPAKAGLHRC